MEKYTIYPKKTVSFRSKQGTRYKISNINGKMVCFLNGKKCAPTKEILSRFTLPGGSFTIYTDGGCLHNPGGRGGYGVVIIQPDGKMIQLSGGYLSTTNNRMELIAAIKGIISTPRSAKINLHSDSRYLVSTMNGAYRKTKNLDLWEELDKACSVRTVQFHWVKGHAKNHLNEVCDRLAKEAMYQKNLATDQGYAKKPAPKIHLDNSIPKRGKVNKVCQDLIEDFYKKDTHSFEDYAVLKTGGKDIYSEKGVKELQSICKADINKIAAHIDNRDVIYALRWHCRGLSLKDSVTKVIVDNKIKERIERTKK